jgi:hypothetical protein
MAWEPNYPITQDRLSISVSRAQQPPLFLEAHLSGFRMELIITSIQTPFYYAGFYVKALHFCFEL